MTAEQRKKKHFWRCKLLQRLDLIAENVWKGIGENCIQLRMNWYMRLISHKRLKKLQRVVLHILKPSFFQAMLMFLMISGVGWRWVFKLNVP